MATPASVGSRAVTLAAVLALAWPQDAGAASCHSELSIITDVDPAHVVAQVREIVGLLHAHGAPLAAAEAAVLEDAFRDPDAGRGLTAIQQVVDRYCLLAVSISAEGEVRTSAGPARPLLARGEWACFLIKVDNGARLTSPLEVVSEQAVGTGPPSRDRWLRHAVEPAGRLLSGRRLDYFVHRLRGDDAGDREAGFFCRAGSRAWPDRSARLLLSVPVLFSIRPPEEAAALRRAAARHVHKEPKPGPPLAVLREASCRRCHTEIDPARARPEQIAAENRCRACHRSGLPAARDGAPPAAAVKADPAAVLSLFPSADPARGSGLFFRQPLPGCSNCHRLGERGSAVGPDLARLGERVTPAEALESILHPSAAIAEGFRTVIVVTEDERIVSGIPRRETAESLVVVEAGGREIEVPRPEVRERRAEDVSLMPEGAADGLDARALADLLAFLLRGVSADGRPAGD